MAIAGLDTVSVLWGGVDVPGPLDETTSASGSWAKGWRYVHTLSSGARLLYGIGGRARVEASVSRLARGDNVEPVPVGEGLDALRASWEEAVRLVGGTTDLERRGPRSALTAGRERRRWEDCQVTRLDVTRDFRVEVPPVVFMATHAVMPVRGVGAARMFRRDGALTVVRGNGARSAELYDKEGEVRGRRTPQPEWVRELAAGRLRSEARCRRRPLQAVGMGRVGQITAEKVDRLGEAVFEWAGYHQGVSDVDYLQVLIDRDHTLTPQRRMMLRGLLVELARGRHPVRDGGLSRNTWYRYRDELLRLGFLPGTLTARRLDALLRELDEDDTPPATATRHLEAAHKQRSDEREIYAERLDYPSGRLVAA